MCVSSTELIASFFFPPLLNEITETVTLFLIYFWEQLFGGKKKISNENRNGSNPPLLREETQEGKGDEGETLV